MPRLSTRRLTKTIIEQTPPGATAWDSEVRGFGLRRTISGHPSFIVAYRMSSRQQRKMVLGPYPALTVEQARNKAREVVVAVRNGEDPAGDRRRERAIPTLRERLEHYCGAYAVQNGLRARTISAARCVVERYALPSLGSRSIEKISRGEIVRLHGRTKEVSGSAQANRLLAVLSRIYSIALEEELVNESPCKNVKRWAENQRFRNFSDEEVQRILGACDGYYDPLAANAIRLLLLTGARLNELLRADWDQFDLGRGLWTKPSSHTKQKREHRVMLPDQALHILRAMQAEASGSRYLFPGRSRSDPSSDQPRADLKRPWAFVCQHAGLSDARIHDMRRTTASMMLSEGVDLSTVGKTLGHTQASTTNRYATLYLGSQRAALTKAADRMFAPPASPS